MIAMGWRIGKGVGREVVKIHQSVEIGMPRVLEHANGNIGDPTCPREKLIAKYNGDPSKVQLPNSGSEILAYANGVNNWHPSGTTCPRDCKKYNGDTSKVQLANISEILATHRGWGAKIIAKFLASKLCTQTCTNVCWKVHPYSKMVVDFCTAVQWANNGSTLLYCVQRTAYSVPKSTTYLLLPGW